MKKRKGRKEPNKKVKNKRIKNTNGMGTENKEEAQWEQIRIMAPAAVLFVLLEWVVFFFLLSPSIQYK